MIKLWLKAILNKDLSTVEKQELSEFFRNVLGRRSSSQIKLMSSLFYRPRKLIPVKNWHTGYRPNIFSAYRLFLKSLWERIKTMNAKNIKIKWYANKPLNIPTKSEIAECLFLGGYYEPNEILFLEKYMKKGMVFVDIGAHIGLYTVFAALHVGKSGKIFAFEPSNREYQTLLQNTSPVRSFVEIFKNAISDKEGQMVLSIADDFHNGHNALGKLIYPSVRIIRKEVVETTTLDSFVDHNEIEHIDIVKIDVEGHESNVLLGAKETIKRFKPLILVEVSNLEPVKILKKHGYHLYNFSRQTGSWVKLDNFNTKNTGTSNIVASYKTLKLGSLR